MSEPLLKNIFLLTEEIKKRGKFSEWRRGKYHPDEDPTFPKELLELSK